MYCEFYQLTERPFNVTPDPKFLYLNARYREAIASLNYGITQRKGFITLIGEAGTGKTTLLKRLLEDLDTKTKSVFIFNTNVTFEEILEYIFAEFDLPVHNGKKLYMLQRLNSFLLEELRGGGNVALLIDEAQDLEFSVLEDLRLLSNLETAKEKILQIVLSGQPELGQKLSNPILRQLRQRIGINCRLLPLSRDEITEYIRFRLQAAGCPDFKLFSREAEDQIYHFSRGIPRLVNVVCDNALVIGYALGKKRIGADIITEAAADLLSVESSAADDAAQRPVAMSSAPAVSASVSQNRWRTRLGVVAMVSLALIIGLLSVGRTMWPKRSEGPRSAAVAAPHLDVIRPGSQPQGTGIDVAAAALDSNAPQAAAPRDDRLPPDTAAEVIDPRRDVRRNDLLGPQLAAGTRPEPASATDVPPPVDTYHPAPAGSRPALPSAADLDDPQPAAADGGVTDEVIAHAAGGALPHGNAPSHTDPNHPMRAGDTYAPEAVVKRVDAPKIPPPPMNKGAAPHPAKVDPAAKMANAAPPRPVEVARADEPFRTEEPPPRDDAGTARDAGGEPATAAESGPGPRLDGVQFGSAVVQNGDSMTGIALRKYGQASSTILDLLRLANPELRDIDHIAIGQKVRLPELSEGFPILHDGSGNYSLLVFSTPLGNRAGALQSALRGRGFDAHVVGARGAHKATFRVVISGFKTRDEVVALGRQLQKLFREDTRMAQLGG